MRLPTLHTTRRDWLLLAIGAAVAVGTIETVHLIRQAQVPLAYQSAGLTSPWVPETVKRWQTPINTMAKKYNVVANLVAIIMTLESGGFSQANSGEATGLMQITPGTATDIAAKYLKQPTTEYNITDPTTNIEFGTAYLAYLRDEFGSVSQGPSWLTSVELLAAGYNGGPGAANDLEQGHGLNDTETVVYSRDAFNMWRERASPTSPTYSRWLERGGQTLLDQAVAEQAAAN